MWDFIKRLGALTAIFGFLCTFMFYVISWYHEVNGEIHKIPVLVEQVDELTVRVDELTVRVDELGEEVAELAVEVRKIPELTETLNTLIRLFNALSPEQQAALRSAFSNAAANASAAAN